MGIVEIVGRADREVVDGVALRLEPVVVTVKEFLFGEERSPREVAVDDADRVVLVVCCHKVVSRLLDGFKVTRGDVSGPLDGAGEFVAMARADAAGGMTTLPGNLLGKVKPAAHALVAKIIDALVIHIGAVLDNIENGTCQIAGIGRRSHLVEDNLQFGFGGSEVEHG